MKSKEFLSELRMIIREEVSYAVRQELKKVLTESAPIQKNHPVPPVLGPTPKQKPIPTKKKLNFKDPILAELLESVNSNVAPEYNQHVDYQEWPTMQYGNDMNFGHNTINAAPTGMNIEAIEEAAPGVAAALTRDYRDLIKAIDKKKGK